MMYLFIVDLRRLKEPLLNLDIRHENDMYLVTSLPDGGCLVCMKTYTFVTKSQVLRLDKNGNSLEPRYKCKSDIRGIIHSNGTVYILECDGTITKHSLSYLSEVIQTYKVDVTSLYPGDMLDEHTLILVDYGSKHGEVFTFNMSTKKKEVKVTKLWSPVNVVFVNYSSLFAVCEHGDGNISLYDESWRLEKTINLTGKENRKMWSFPSFMFTPFGTLLVCDSDNNRISEFSIPDGILMKQFITGIFYPLSMSYNYPCLWVSHGKQGGQLKRYKLYK